MIFADMKNGEYVFPEAVDATREAYCEHVWRNAAELWYIISGLSFTVRPGAAIFPHKQRRAHMHPKLCATPMEFNRF
jgi:hypothetical protein